MNSSNFSTHGLMSYNIPHITLSSVSAEKQHQADREFSMRVTFDVAGLILSTLSQIFAQRFSVVGRSGLLTDFDRLRPNVREVELAPPLNLGGGVS